MGKKQRAFYAILVAALWTFLGYSLADYRAEASYNELVERHQALSALNTLCSDLNENMISLIDPTAVKVDMTQDELIDGYLTVPEENRADFNELYLELQELWLNQMAKNSE